MEPGVTPSSLGSDVSRPKTPVIIDSPLTDAQLIKCAGSVIGKLINSGSRMIRMIEPAELEAMAREAVVVADRRYRSCEVSRWNWAINKGAFLVMDMVRQEARHVVCLSVGEFRGTKLDKDGNRIKNRNRIPMGNPEFIPGAQKPQPAAYLRSASPSPLMTTHNRHLHERLERALDNLPDQRAAVAFRLSVWHDWTQEDIAELFGVTPSRISQMLTRARGRLQVQFQDLTPEQRAA